MTKFYNASAFLQAAKNFNASVKLSHGLLTSTHARTLLRVSTATLNHWVNGSYKNYMFEFQESLCPADESKYFNEPVFFDRLGHPASPGLNTTPHSVHDKPFVGNRAFTPTPRKKCGLIAPVSVEGHIASMQCLLEESFEQLKIDMQLSDTRASMLEDCARHAFDPIRIGQYSARASVLNHYSPIDIALFQLMNSIPITPQLKSACEAEYMHTGERMPRFRPKLQPWRKYEGDEAPLIYHTFVGGLALFYTTIRRSLVSKSGASNYSEFEPHDNREIKRKSSNKTTTSPSSMPSAYDDFPKKPHTIITHCTGIARSILSRDFMSPEELTSLITGSIIHGQMRSDITIFPGSFLNTPSSDSEASESIATND